MLRSQNILSQSDPTICNLFVHDRIQTIGNYDTTDLSTTISV